MLAQQQNKNESVSSTIVQPKLEIGEEDDEHEKEADGVADKVMRMSSGSGDDSNISNGKEKIQTMSNLSSQKVQKMHTGIPAIQKMSSENKSGINAPASVEKGINSSKGSGQNLTPEVQEEMGSKMGTDLSNVKVHTDSNAVQMSKDINAKAFTHGNDVYFNQGQYNPTSNEGKHLLAHELTHTVQQSGQIKPKIQRTIAQAAAAISAGNIQAGLADPAMRAAISSAGGTTFDLRSMETVLNGVLATGLGLASPKPPVLTGAPFSQYTILERSSIAYTLGMVKERQEYIDKYNQFLVNTANPLSPNPATDFMNANLSMAKILADIRLNDPGAVGPTGTGISPAVFNMISENPDMALMTKSLMLVQLIADLRNGTTSTTINYPPNTDPTPFNTIYNTPGYQTEQGLLLNDQARIKTLIDKQAKMLFGGMGAPVDATMGDSLLASSGDTSGSSGLFGSREVVPITNANDSVGVGYFMYSRQAGQPINSGLIGNNLTVTYPAGGTQLSILLNAYGFDMSTAVTVTVTAGVGTGQRTFIITINGAPGARGTNTTPGSTIPGIIVSPGGPGTSASITLDNTFSGAPVQLVVSRGAAVPAAGTLTRMDEVQMMITTNGTLGGIVQSLEAKELFDSGSFISKSIPTLQNSARPSDKELAKKIIAFSDGLNINAITTLLTATTSGTADFSSFFKLEGKGINTGAPIPKPYKAANSGLTDAQLLKKIEQMDKGELVKCYHSDPDFSEMSYEKIIAMLEEYRSSKANATGTVNITSTTDPQGTGKNPGVNNDFPDYFNEYIKGTVFGNAVEPLLNMDGTEISRDNNDALSALRSLSFLKLILMQKDLTETDFAKMNVKVTVGTTEVPANLGEIPTEASASNSVQASADRKKFSTGNVNDYQIQVMASKPDDVDFQKDLYESRGWSCTTEPASDGSTRLLVQNFANVNDAMAKLNQIRAEGYPHAFVKTKPK